MTVDRENSQVNYNREQEAYDQAIDKLSVKERVRRSVQGELKKKK